MTDDYRFQSARTRLSRAAHRHSCACERCSGELVPEECRECGAEHDPSEDCRTAEVERG